MSNAGLEAEKFDTLLKELRDTEQISLHSGDATAHTPEENAKNFIDENGFRMGTFTVTGELKGFRVSDERLNEILKQPEPERRAEVPLEQKTLDSMDDREKLSYVVAMAKQAEAAGEQDRARVFNGAAIQQGVLLTGLEQPGKSGFYDIFKLRDIMSEAGLEPEKFDTLLKGLRDADQVQLHTSDASLMSQQQLDGCFIDENGFRMGSMTLYNRSLESFRVTEQKLGTLLPKTPQQDQSKPVDRDRLKDDHIIIAHVTGPKQGSKAGKADDVSPPSESVAISWDAVQVGQKVVFQPYNAKSELRGTVTAIKEDKDGNKKVTLRCGRVSATVSEDKGVLKEQTQEKARAEKPRYEKAVGLEL